MRVISGEARGRKLKSPPGSATRPTADRVRQTIFDILGRVEDLRVLDLFAGTGSLGIEALSRGATFAVFVEQAASVAKFIRQNIEMLGYQDRAAISQIDARKMLALQTPSPYDLVFLDPPYDTGLASLSDLVALVAGRGWIAQGGMLVVESPVGASFTKCEPLSEIKRRMFGRTQITFLERG